MSPRALAAATALAAALAAAPALPAEPAPALDPAMGYVAAVSTVALLRRKGFDGAKLPEEAGQFDNGFIVIVTDPVGREYYLSMGEPPDEQVVLLPLPPGEYAVKGWYPGKAKQFSGAGVPPKSFFNAEGTPLLTPFLVQAGQVVLLGRFRSERLLTDKPGIGAGQEVRWIMLPKPLRADEPPALLAKALPAFAAAPLRCLSCTAAAAGATATAAPAEAPPPHERRIVIHYRRPDGKYDGWGLLAWESFPVAGQEREPRPRTSAQDRVVVNATLEKPLPPDGVDAYGAFWKLDERDFRNGRVNYVIHRGQDREQGGQDRFWLTRDGLEIWVRSGEPTLYRSEAEATAAAK